MRNLLKKSTGMLLLLLSSLYSFGQDESPKHKLASQIFLPSIELGYQQPTSSIISGSMIAKTSIEYRFRNNNDFFLRLSFDTYSARYTLQELNATTNTIEGTVQFTDIMLAPGYRLGDEKVRLVFALMAGMKQYEFPNAEIRGNTVTIRQDNQSLFTTSVLTALEYYFDHKSAITLSLHQNQVWQKVDFWEDGMGAYGISLGFITSLL